MRADNLVESHCVSATKTHVLILSEALKNSRCLRDVMCRMTEIH